MLKPEVVVVEASRAWVMVVKSLESPQLKSQVSSFSHLVVIEERMLRMKDPSEASTRHWKACQRPGDECQGWRRVVGRSVGSHRVVYTVVVE